MSMSTTFDRFKRRRQEAMRRKRQEDPVITIKSESEEEEERIYDNIRELCAVKRELSTLKNQTKGLIAKQYKNLDQVRRRRELKAAILKERMKQEEKRRRELREERLEFLPELREVATQTEKVLQGSVLNDFPSFMGDFSSATILNFKSQDGHEIGHLDTNLGNALETISTLVDSNDKPIDFTIRKVASNEVPKTSKYFNNN